MYSLRLGNLLLPQRWPKLNAQSIINLTLQLLQRVPNDLYRSLMMHPYSDVKEIYKHKKKKLPFGAQSSSDLKLKERKVVPEPSLQVNKHDQGDGNDVPEMPIMNNATKPDTETSGEFSDALLWIGVNANPIKNNTNMVNNESPPKKKDKIRMLQ